MEATKPTTDPREARGREIARKGKIRKVGKRWLVPSESEASKSYVVDLIDASCSCPDYETRRCKCKHRHAVEFAIIWSQSTAPDGTVTEMLTLKRKTYPQDWPRYNAAQVAEQEMAEEFLSQLCEGVVEPPLTNPEGDGHPRLPLADVVFAMVHKVYTGMSGRRAQSALRRCQERGLISVVPSYNRIFRAFESPSLAPVLERMIQDAASPLRAVEREFAQDSTGIGTQVYKRWFDEKYVERTRAEFVKLHALCGTFTNVIVEARVTDAADCPMLEPMLNAAVARGFTIGEVTGDKAYSSKRNIEVIAAIGAQSYIMFKDNATGRGPDLWRQRWAALQMHRLDYLKHYHKRSNAETTFHMVKAKFGPSVRSKLPVARAAEVLAKVLCHNLAVLVSAFFELGIKPSFETGQ